eukprot:546095_1
MRSHAFQTLDESGRGAQPKEEITKDIEPSDVRLVILINEQPKKGYWMMSYSTECRNQSGVDVIATTYTDLRETNSNEPEMCTVPSIPSFCFVGPSFALFCDDIRN